MNFHNLPLLPYSLTFSRRHCGKHVAYVNMSVSRLNGLSGLSHKNEVITRTYGTEALRFISCARLSEEIRVAAAAKCAGGSHSSRA